MEELPWSPLYANGWHNTVGAQLQFFWTNNYSLKWLENLVKWMSRGAMEGNKHHSGTYVEGGTWKIKWVSQSAPDPPNPVHPHMSICKRGGLVLRRIPEFPLFSGLSLRQHPRSRNHSITWKSRAMEAPPCASPQRLAEGHLLAF